MEATDPAAAADRWFDEQMRDAENMAQYSASVANALFSLHVHDYIESEKMLNRYDTSLSTADRHRRHATQKNRNTQAIKQIAGNIGMLLIDAGLPEAIVEDIESIVNGVLVSPRNRREVQMLPDKSSFEAPDPIGTIVFDEPPF